MSGVPNLAETLKLISDPTRIELLTVLMDNRYYTVTELSKKVHVSLSTTSYHLKKLSEMGWVDTYKQGKNVYYGLVSESVATILESLMNISAPKKINSYNQKQEYTEIKDARTCYSHLAGRFGVNLFEFLIENNYLTKNGHELSVTEIGREFLEDIGMEQTELLEGKFCMDWSERKFHLAGTLGKEIYAHFLKQGWVKKSEKNRSIVLTVFCPEWLRAMSEMKHKEV